LDKISQTRKKFKSSGRYPRDEGRDYFAESLASTKLNILKKQLKTTRSVLTTTRYFALLGLFISSSTIHNKNASQSSISFSKKSKDFSVIHQKNSPRKFIKEAGLRHTIQ